MRPKLFLPFPPYARSGQVAFLLFLASANGRHVTYRIDIDGNIYNDTNDGNTNDGNIYNDTNVDDFALEDLGSGEEIQCGLSKEDPLQTSIWNTHDADQFEHPWQVREICITNVKLTHPGLHENQVCSRIGTMWRKFCRQRDYYHRSPLLCGTTLWPP
jgi:hypothetical protein